MAMVAAKCSLREDFGVAAGAGETAPADVPLEISGGIGSVDTRAGGIAGATAASTVTVSETLPAAAEFAAGDEASDFFISAGFVILYKASPSRLLNWALVAS